MKKFLFYGVALVALMMTSCKSTSYSVQAPANRIDFQKSDFAFSGQVEGTATSKRILGIDWWRLLNVETTNIDDATKTFVPTILGNAFPAKSAKTENMALRDMTTKNPGYDVIFILHTKQRFINLL